MKHIPPFLLVFDVESIGLHGTAISVAGVVLNTETGETNAPFSFHTDWLQRDNLHFYQPDDVTWCAKNVKVHKDSVEFEDTKGIRTAFWNLWEHLGKDVGMATECGWPVEARFLNKCIDDDRRTRNWGGPYPLHEISSFMIAAGMDPMETYKRLPDEMPAHEPLADARLSARLMFTAIEKIHAGMGGRQ